MELKVMGTARQQARHNQTAEAHEGEHRSDHAEDEGKKPEREETLDAGVKGIGGGVENAHRLANAVAWRRASGVAAKDARLAGCGPELHDRIVHAARAR